MDSWIIAYLVVASIALLVNGIAIYYLIRFGSLTAITTRLVLFLHVSLLIENIGALPVVYNGNQGACNVMGFLYFYGVSANILSITLLTAVYHNFVFDKVHRNSFIKKYAFFIAFIVPLAATLLPYSTKGYLADDDWCVVDTNWAYVVYVPGAIALFSGAFGYILYNTWSEEIVSKRLLSTVGMYIGMSYFAWIVSITTDLVEYFGKEPVSTGSTALDFGVGYVTAMAYAVSFVYNYSLFTKYEMETSNTRSSSMHITFAAFEAALSDIEFNDNDAENGNKIKPSHSRSRVLDVSKDSVDANSNYLIKTFLEKNTILANSQQKVSEMPTLSAAEDSVQNPIFDNIERGSTHSVLEVERDSVDERNNT
jgi:hypothetical protein